MKSLFSHITGFCAGDEDLPLSVLTVWRRTRVVRLIVYNFTGGSP